MGKPPLVLRCLPMLEATLKLTVGVVMAGGDPPLACNIKAISADQRPRYNALVKQLRAALQSRQDLSNGYVYAIDIKQITLQEIAEWITPWSVCAARSWRSSLTCSKMARRDCR